MEPTRMNNSAWPPIALAVAVAIICVTVAYILDYTGISGYLGRPSP